MNSMPVRFHQTLLNLPSVMLVLVLLSSCAKQHTPTALRASDAEMGRLAQQAKSLFEMQRPAQAAPLYQAALDRARALNDDTAIARLAHNLGACRLESGDAAGACVALEEAVHAACAAGLAVEESRLLLGYSLLQQGETDRTLVLCNKAIETMGDRADPNMSLRFQLLRAEAYLRADQLESAEETLREVSQQMTPKSALAIQAWAAHIEGMIQMRREHPSESAKAFLREAGFWGRANRPMDVATALVRAADEEQHAKEISAEADSRYRAARALLGLGRFKEALAQLDRLESLASNEWPESLVRLAPLLRHEIDQRVPAKTEN